MNEESGIVFDPPTPSQISYEQSRRDDTLTRRCPSANGTRTLRREQGTEKLKLARAFSYQTLRSSSQSTTRSNGGKGEPLKEGLVLSRENSYQSRAGASLRRSKEKEFMMTLGANLNKQSDLALSSQEKSEANSYPSKNMSGNSSPIHSGSGCGSSSAGNQTNHFQQRSTARKESVAWGGFSPMNPLLNISTASSIMHGNPPPHYSQHSGYSS